ncbi:uncharacterized protein A1O9_11088 [Exophiala aquamarina CBS 119918]|uniref:J domain-containing protein n=1 Tax=Exophiala aquamarina CBS 119918 TaxID=1182545 RepID=A0A072NYL8_9EURO|nr:uncharacterized protein A1O9_11088 [Exophiala aquamarina CBS 119918]KEF52671.1 hypothetical protein A1O9_11088 [Exophiala aquamarina CBS 119918]
MLLRPCSLPNLHLAVPPSAPKRTSFSLIRVARDQIQLRHARRFSSRPALCNAASPPTHYDVLKLLPTATAAELKRQFYVLSKETHPDHNRDDPKAADRFAQISESYSVLANPEKRKRYDRDVMRAHHASHHRRHHGSHSSHSTYAGSRPATGLSKRRSAFKGPPPSFYAHGNPSAHTAQQTQSSSSATGPNHHKAGTFNAGAYTDPGHYDSAFNSSAVYKTQTHEDYRRTNRRAAEAAAMQAMAEDEGNFWTRFIVVGGILVLSVTFASFIAATSMPSGRGGLVKADGSRRDGLKR